MSIEIRQDSASGLCYMRIRNANYQNLSKKIQRLSGKINRAKSRHQEEAERMSRVRARLMEERRQAEQYIQIAPRDIPAGARIQPFYKLTGQIVEVSPAKYRELVNQIHRTGVELEWGDAI